MRDVLCTVIGTMGVDPEVRKYVGALCVFVKVTKSGLVQVARVIDRSHTVSVPPSNIKFHKKEDRELHIPNRRQTLEVCQEDQEHSGKTYVERDRRQNRTSQLVDRHT
jgi:hypothetical protein